MIAHSLCFIS